MRIQTFLKRNYDVALKTLAIASLVGAVVLGGGCSQLEKNKAQAIKRQQEYEHTQAKKYAVLDSVRAERRLENYLEPKTFTNSNRSIDLYFPIEDLLMNRDDWQIFYTDRITKEVKTIGFQKHSTKLIRDANTNQTAYAEWLNSNTSFFEGGDPQEVIIHIRDNTRINGGKGYVRSGNTTTHYPIQTIDISEGK